MVVFLIISFCYFTVFMNGGKCTTEIFPYVFACNMFCLVSVSIVKGVRTLSGHLCPSMWSFNVTFSIVCVTLHFLYCEILALRREIKI